MTIAENITTSHAGMTKVNEPRAGVGRVRLCRSLARLLLAGALTALLPLFLDTYWTRLAVFVFINIGLASAWNVIGGMAGYPSFGHSMFFGIGAYVSAIVMVRYQLPMIVAIPASAIVTAVFSLADRKSTRLNSRH